MKPPVHVIGSGIAGLTFALAVAEKSPVVVLTKKAAVESNTNYAQGGIAAAFGKDDSIELHKADTVSCGAGLCDPEIVDIVVSEGPALVRGLLELGADFRRDSAGNFDLGREGGHSRNRVIHSGDATGREIERVLLGRLEAHPNITLLPYHFVLDILLHDGRVCGLLVMNPDGLIRIVGATKVCLSTGGLGWIFRYTTNPEIATGDGIAMGYRAGARLRDLEFIQFHPTAFARPGSGAFLISEAVRGEGAVLRNLDGERFMARYAPDMMELAPRDVVARAIDTEMKTRGDEHVLLDVTSRGKAFLKDRFPTIYSTCLLHGIEIDRHPIPVVPAAHYSCGGVLTDQYGRSTVPGLYCIGETASHGLHGANRLASNSLLEALVFARRGAIAILDDSGEFPAARDCEVSMSERPVCGLCELYSDRLRTAMSRSVGIFRKRSNLNKALVEFTALTAGIRRLLRTFRIDRDLVELANMAQCGELIIRSALMRRESRGLHALEDAEPAETPPAHTFLQNEKPAPFLEGLEKLVDVRSA